jgi:hypothetical protein
MRLDMDRQPGLVGKAPPAFQEGNARLQPVRPHIRLQIDVVGAEPCHEVQHRLQLVDRPRVALRLPGQAMVAQEACGLRRECRIDKADPRPVEAGIPDHRELVRSGHSG